MANVNNVTISGNVIEDAEVKYVGSDGDFAICEFRVAVNGPSKRQDDGSYVDGDASYLDCKAFGKFAELLGRKLEKADRVTVEGRLKQERWQNDAGENRSKVVIIVNQLDSDALFKTGGEIKVAEGNAAPSTGPAAGDDDIPF